MDIAAKERVQAWAELEQVKQSVAGKTTAPQLSPVRSADRPSDTNAKLRELNQVLNERQAQLAHANSQVQVRIHDWSVHDASTPRVS